MVPQSEGKRLEGKPTASQVKNEYLDTPLKGLSWLGSVNPSPRWSQISQPLNLSLNNILFIIILSSFFPSFKRLLRGHLLWDFSFLSYSQCEVVYWVSRLCVQCPVLAPLAPTDAFVWIICGELSVSSTRQSLWGKDQGLIAHYLCLTHIKLKINVKRMNKMDDPQIFNWFLE